MVLLKSFGVGLLGVVVLIPIGQIALIAYLSITRGQNIGVDIVSLSRDWVARIVILLVFLLGFSWEYRRLVRR